MEIKEKSGKNGNAGKHRHSLLLEKERRNWRRRKDEMRKGGREEKKKRRGQIKRKIFPIPNLILILHSFARVRGFSVIRCKPDMVMFCKVCFCCYCEFIAFL